MTQIHYSLILAAASLLVTTTLASPRLSFPINSQVPPVAYASVPYTFAFSPDTFQSNSDISYSVSNEPAWLMLDNASRTFSGTPTIRDIGDTTFQLTASDADGQTASSVTLVILATNEVTLKGEQDLLPQLARTGKVSAPATLLLYPTTEFSFTFSKDIFSDVSAKTVFYAISADNSPLPSWLHFDVRNLTFSGTTPSLPFAVGVRVPYDLNVVASNVIGFSEAIASFQIMVATSILSFEPTVRSISVVKGERVTISSLLRSLTRDGSPVNRNDVSLISSDHPVWLVLKDTDLSLEGVVPLNALDVVFSVHVLDSGGDSATASISIHILDLSNDQNSTLPNTGYQTDLGTVNATAGTFFTYEFGAPNLITDLLSITAHLSTTAASWISFSPSNMSIQGHVPPEIGEENIVSIVFSQDSMTLQTTFVRVEVVSELSSSMPSATMNATIFAPVKPTMNSSTSADPGSGQSRTTDDRILKVVLSTVLSSFVLVAVILLVLWLCHRKRVGYQRSRVTKTKMQEEVTPSHETVLFTASPPTAAQRLRSLRRESMAPPQVELLWPSDSIRYKRNRVSGQKESAQDDIRLSSDNFTIMQHNRHHTHVGWGDIERDSTPSHQGDDLSPLTRVSVNRSGDRKVLRTLQNTPQLSTVQKASTRMNHYISPDPNSRILFDAVDHSKVPNKTNLQRIGRNNSWETTFSTMPKSPSTSSVALETFPEPPRDGDNERNSAESFMQEEMLSIKSARRNSSDSSKSFEASRQHFHTQRARDRLEGVARFSNAGANRSLSGQPMFSPPRRNSQTLRAEEKINRQRTPSWSQWSGIAMAQNDENIRESLLHKDLRKAHNQQFGSEDLFVSQQSYQDLGPSQSIREDFYRQGSSDPDRLNTPSPRLPFHLHDHRYERSNMIGISAPQRPRLADQRKHVSVESSELERSQRSFEGSLRFL